MPIHKYQNIVEGASSSEGAKTDLSFPNVGRPRQRLRDKG
jgi:hypothetical protein